MPYVKGKGYVPGDDSEATGRTARPREREEEFWGRRTPDNPPLSFARMMGVEILQAESDVEGQAKTDILAAWNTWKSLPANERRRILDLSFEHYVKEDDVEGFVLYITYSK